MDIPADEAWVADLVAGREEAFERLYDALGARMLRTARSIAGTQEDAEDAVQDVFVSLVHAGPGLSKVQNLNAYIFSAVHRAAVRRAEKRRSERAIDKTAFEFALNDRAAPNDVAPDSSDRLNRALDSLPTEQREIIALKVDGELSFEEAAAVLNVSINTAASRYRYALAKLRAALGHVPARTEPE